MWKWWCGNALMPEGKSSEMEMREMREIKNFLLLGTIFVFVACAGAVSSTHAPVPTQNSVAPTERIVVAPTNSPQPSTATAIPPSATPIPPTATATMIPPTPPPTPLGALKAETNAAWETFVASLEADSAANAQVRVNEFWDVLVSLERVPLILEDAAIFLYKGDAASVAWRGDFSYWQFGTGIEGQRIGATDLWYGVADFPRDSRAEYKIVLNGSRWILDPANPQRQGGGFGDNSVLTMPAFRVTDFTARRADVPQGTLTDWITLESKVWGAPVNYRVYLPPNYSDPQNFPVVYVTDGNDFSDARMGAMQIVLDNLIAAQKIAPLIAVYIDARDPTNLENNQREIQFLARPEDFAAMLTTEVVTTIDARFRTNRAREARALVGTSYGGVFTTFAGLKYPAVFGQLGIFSPAYWVLQNPAGVGGGALTAGARRMNELIQKEMTTQAVTPSRIFLSAGIPNWDVGNMEPWAQRFRARGDEVGLFNVQEGHSWGAWSGLTDELLEYFFGD